MAHLFTKRVKPKGKVVISNLAISCGLAVASVLLLTSCFNDLAPSKSETKCAVGDASCTASANPGGATLNNEIGVPAAKAVMDRGLEAATVEVVAFISQDEGTPPSYCLGALVYSGRISQCVDSLLLPKDIDKFGNISSVKVYHSPLRGFSGRRINSFTAITAVRIGFRNGGYVNIGEPAVNPDTTPFAGHWNESCNDINLRKISYTMNPSNNVGATLYWDSCSEISIGAEDTIYNFEYGYDSTKTYLNYFYIKKGIPSSTTAVQTIEHDLKVNERMYSSHIVEINPSRAKGCNSAIQGRYQIPPSATPDAKLFESGLYDKIEDDETRQSLKYASRVNTLDIVSRDCPTSLGLQDGAITIPSILGTTGRGGTIGAALMQINTVITGSCLSNDTACLGSHLEQIDTVIAPALHQYSSPRIWNENKQRALCSHLSTFQMRLLGNINRSYKSEVGCVLGAKCICSIAQ